MKYVYLLLIPLFFVGCKDTYSESDLKNFNEQIEAYIANQSSAYKKTESGLYYVIVEEETSQEKEPLKLNDEVVFYYEGSLLEGEVFQKIEKEEALQFMVKELIYGWQEALGLIAPKGRIKIILPPSLGYGDNKTELVPANSILLFDLTLVKTI